MVRRWALVPAPSSAAAARAALDARAADDPTGLLVLHRAAAELLAEPGAPWGEPLRQWHREMRRALGPADTHAVYGAIGGFPPDGADGP